MRADHRTARPGACAVRAIYAALAATIIALVATPPAAARDTTTAASPVTTISADEAEIDIHTGERTYRRNVRVQHGDMRLRADELTMEYGDNGLQRIIASGAPAEFHKPADGDTAAVSGSGNHLQFIENTRILTLSDSARLSVGKDRIRGEYIIYDVDRGVMSVTGAESQIDTESDAR